MTAPKAGVMGWPVSHSLSPKLHNHWLKMLNIAGSYEALPVKPEDLAQAFRDLPAQGFRGWNMTLPHKEAAMELVDELDESAAKVGAVNTVVVRGGKLIGSNTDAYGFSANLIAQGGNLAPYLPRVLIMGAGGAARAVVYALKSLGAGEIAITNRTETKAELLAKEFGLYVVPWEGRNAMLEEATMLINATTQGMQGQQPLNLTLNSLPREALVTDIVYAPLETPLLTAARERGNKIVTGLGMLIHQAVPGFKAWFGAEPPVTHELETLLLS